VGNIPVTPGVSDSVPWLGTYRGVPAVLRSLEVWAKHVRLLSFKLLRLMVDGPEAVGIVHEHGQCVANGKARAAHTDTSTTSTLRRTSGSKAARSCTTECIGMSRR
jgi:hypothetical protein